MPDLVAPPRQTLPPDTGAGALQAEEVHFWDLIERMVGDLVAKLLPRRDAEVLSIQFPLGGATPATLMGSVTVGFQARVVGYTFTSIAGGAIVVDVLRSAPLTHPLMDSLPGPLLYPALNGFVTEPGTDDVSGWVNVDLMRLDMLHVYCVDVAQPWVDGVFTLHIVRLT